MKVPWLAVGGNKDRGHYVNWGWSEKSLDKFGSEVIKGKTVGGIGFGEIALITIGTGILIKVALPFARALLGF